MTPREHLRKMTALGEQGALDEKNWYRLVNGMSAGELRQRQEMMMRNQMAMAPQILAQGQQRLQGQFDTRFMEREMVPPAEMVSSEASQMHMGSHLGQPIPSHAISGRVFPGAGYGFLPSEPMETVARRQELNHKQNIARMEMNAILKQKELEKAHHKGLMGIESPSLYQPHHVSFRGRQRMPDGHDVFVHRPTLNELHSNSILVSSSPYPPISRERGRRAGRRPSAQRSTERSSLKGHMEDKVGQSPGVTSGEEKEAEGKGDLGDMVSAGKMPRPIKTDADLTTAGRKHCKEDESGLRKACVTNQDGCSMVLNSGAGDKDMSGQCSAFQDKFMCSSAGGTHPGMPHMFAAPGLLPPGPPNLFLNRDDVSEEIRKWTVDDVHSFISSIPTCSEYAQTFKDHMIDGETLPLLSEEHLLDTLGLKLGPALKVRSQVSRRLGSIFYTRNLPLPSGTLQTAPGKYGDRSSDIGSPVCNSEEMVGSPRDSDDLKTTDHLSEMMENNSPIASSETA